MLLLLMMLMFTLIKARSLRRPIFNQLGAHSVGVVGGNPATARSYFRLFYFAKVFLNFCF